MYDGHVGDSPRNPSGKINHRQKLEQSTFNSIRKMLPDQDIIQACREADYNYNEIAARFIALNIVRTFFDIRQSVAIEIGRRPVEGIGPSSDLARRR